MSGLVHAKVSHESQRRMRRPSWSGVPFFADRSKALTWVESVLRKEQTGSSDSSPTLRASLERKRWVGHKAGPGN